MCGLTENRPVEPIEQKAVLDRIEDGIYAVLLVGDEETEFVISVYQLPEDATPGKWLRVRVEDGAITEITVDEEATQEAAARIAAKMELLRARGRKSRRVRRVK